MRRLLAAVLLLLGTVSAVHASDRPNILWLSAEDISPHHFGCYGGKGAITPTIDRLAQRGVRYTRAFTNAGVCAPSRTGIITGMMPTTIGANHMRSRAHVPDFIKGFPRYLREAGYYCTNNSKTDYNIAGFDAGWHQSNRKAHWRNRPDPDQPFFAVFNYTGTHESRAFADAEKHEKLVAGLSEAERQDPAKLDAPPIYPDTERTRRDQADYHELATALDHWVAKMLRQLEQDGLADDTIVFFWSDHGDGLPRAKRWLYDSGTRIPVVVHVPEKYRVDGQPKPGSVDDQLISGIDFGPTVLNLAGVNVPDHMEGRAFLGADLSKPRKYLYGARDRMDERYDLIRMVRDGRYMYIRNYMPWKPYNQVIRYAEQEATMQELRRLAEHDDLPDNCRWFTAVPKPAEELYDCEADPWQQHNLVGDPDHAATLRRMRAAHRDWLIRTRDTGFVPEPLMADADEQLGSRWAMFHGDDGPSRFHRVMSAAQGADAAALSDDDPIVRFWAVQHLGFAGQMQPLMSMLKDPSPIVRVTAAHWLGTSDHADVALPVLTATLGSENEWVVLAALTALEEMGEAAAPAMPAIRKLKSQKVDGYPGRVLGHILGE